MTTTNNNNDNNNNNNEEGKEKKENESDEEIEEFPFENEEEMKEALETSDSDYDTSADEEDADNDIHPPDGFLSKRGEFKENVSLEKLNMLLQDPKNAPLEDRAWLDAVHTRLLRALLQVVSDSAQYEDEEDTAENFGVMRRNVNVLTWPEIFRQYLYLIIVSTRPYRNTASKERFFSIRQRC